MSGHLPNKKTRILSFREAIREALREELRRDDRVFLVGEDIGLHGGAYFATEGLYKEFGEERVKDTPISESAIIGTAAGASMMGLRPVAEIMFCDFLTVTMDTIVNQIAKMRYMFGGRISLPLVIRTTYGAGASAAAQHSQSLESWFTHIPGLKVVMPTTPYDAKGLLKAAIRDENPVIFFEHKGLYDEKGPVPEEDYLVPLGSAEIRQEGQDVTVIGYGKVVNEALSAAREMGNDLSLEVIDCRTLAPLDMDTLVESVKKTGRVLIVYESYRTGGFGAEIYARLGESVFEYLDAPMRRLANPDVPIPFNPRLENYVLPTKEKILEEAKRVMRS